MKGLQATHPSATASSHHPRFLLLVVFSVGMVFAFVLSACSAHALSAFVSPYASTNKGCIHSTEVADDP